MKEIRIDNFLRCLDTPRIMHTKLLIRPQIFLSLYQQWEKMRKPEQLQLLTDSFEAEMFGNGATDLRFEQTVNLSRLLWQPSEISIEDLSHWLDFLKDTLLGNQYYNHLSDERVELFDNGIKYTVHRHYLKPKLSFKEIITPDTPHLFGNLYLEHHFNDDFNSLSISAHYFSHKSYQSFEKLMEILLRK